MDKPFIKTNYDYRNSVMGGEYRGVGEPGKVGTKQSPKGLPPKKNIPPKKV